MSTPVDGQLRAALLPHIDYHRGGVSFCLGLQGSLRTSTDAALFVIIGTSHYSGERFTLTRKDFQTPLGVAPTDQQYIDRLVAHYGDGLFRHEIAHLPEHSIELEVVFLQYLYENRRPSGSCRWWSVRFRMPYGAGCLPGFRQTLAVSSKLFAGSRDETAEPICYIISGDLAHIGPKFGDTQPVTEPLLEA